MKMKKNRKILSVACLGVMAFACGALGMNFASRSVAAEDPTPVAFEVNGVSLRQVTNGYDEAVRFRVQMDQSAFGDLATGTTYGAKLLPKKLLGNTPLADSTHEKIKDIAIPAENWEETTADGTSQTVMETTVFVEDIGQEYYGTQIAVVAYYETSGERTYSTQASCSLAEKALSSGVANLEEYYTFTYNYYTSKEDGSTPVKTDTAIYGNTLPTPDESLNKAGYELSWTNKSGSATWDFATNKINGTTNLFANYELITPSEEVDATLKMIDKTQAVAYTTWAGDTSAWAEHYDVEWKLGDVTVENSDWTGMADGLQTLTMTATSKYEQDKVFTPYTVTVDVYDATPEFVGSAQAIKGSKRYDYDATAYTTYGETHTDGTANLIKIEQASSQGETVTVNPLHSENYYQMLANNGEGLEYYIVYDYKLEFGSAITSYAYFDYKGAEHGGQTSQAWQSKAIKLSDFLANVDIEAMRELYEQANQNEGTYERNVLFGTYRYASDNYESTIWMTTPVLVADTETITPVDKGTMLVKTTDQLDLTSIFDTTAYSTYTFVWTLDGATVSSVNPATVPEGIHELKLQATSKITGNTVDACTATLDIYDPAATPVLIDSIQDVKFAQSLDWTSNRGTTSYGTNEDGDEVVIFKCTAVSKQLAVAKFKHTKAYYEKMATEGNWVITFEYWMTGDHTTTYDYTAVSNNLAYWGHDNENKVVSIPLGDFLVSAMDKIASNYEKDNHVGNNYCFIGMYVEDNANESTLTLTLPTIVSAE